VPTDSVTNFILSSSALITGVKGLLTPLVTAGTLHSIDIFEGTETQFLAGWTHQAMPAQCVLRYGSSVYNAGNGPRRVSTFTTFIVMSNMTDRETGQTQAMAVKDAVIAALDHAIVSGHALIRVQSEEYVNLPNSALCVWAVDYEVEDY